MDAPEFTPRSTEAQAACAKLHSRVVNCCRLPRACNGMFWDPGDEECAKCCTPWKWMEPKSVKPGEWVPHGGPASDPRWCKCWYARGGWQERDCSACPKNLDCGSTMGRNNPKRTMRGLQPERCGEWYVRRRPGKSCATACTDVAEGEPGVPHFPCLDGPWPVWSGCD